MLPKPCPDRPRLFTRIATFAALILLLATGCGRQKQPAPPAEQVDSLPAQAGPGGRANSLARADSTAAADSLATALAHPRFRRVALRHSKIALALRDSLGPERWLQVLKLNRLDEAYVRQGDSLVVPLQWGDSLALAPFPRRLEAARDTAKLLLVSIRLQAFAAYDSGRLVQWGPVSTGRKDKPTPVGLYHTNWKDRTRFSTIDEAWLLNWYVNLDNFEGVSFHEYEMPGRPVSHSCVRLIESDARWLYDYADQWRVAADRRTVLSNGTPVVVFGTWRYGRRQPWKYLPERPDAATLVADDLSDALHHLTSRTRPDFSIIPPDSLAAPPGSAPPGPRPPLRPDSAMAPDYSFDTLRTSVDSVRTR